jgi:hypothetical protein
VLEDTATTFAELTEVFSPLVASLVFELTNDQEAIKVMGKLDYHKKKLSGISNYGLVIKLADRLHNVSDNPSDKMLTDTIELLLHVKKVRRLTGSQSKIVKAILTKCEKELNHVLPLSASSA